MKKSPQTRMLYRGAVLPFNTWTGRIGDLRSVRGWGGSRGRLGSARCGRVAHAQPVSSQGRTDQGASGAGRAAEPYVASVAHQAARSSCVISAMRGRGPRAARGAAPGAPVRLARTRNRRARQPGYGAGLRGPDVIRAGRPRPGRAAFHRCPGGADPCPPRDHARDPGPVSGGPGRPAARGRGAAARG